MNKDISTLLRSDTYKTLSKAASQVRNIEQSKSNSQLSISAAFFSHGTIETITPFMKMIYVILPIAAGIGLSVQALINGQLRAELGNPFLASLISFASATLVLVVINLLAGSSFASLVVLKDVHWTKLTGGLMGAVFLTSVIIAVKHMPLTSVVALTIMSQLITAALIDHFGLLKAPVIPISHSKIIGIILLLVGAYLVTKK